MEEEFQQMLSVTTDDNDFPITVLMVDDQEIIAKSVQRMLKDETDIKFRYCQNSVQAIQVAKS
jgi:PleD family two-component response regulator